jgi:RNA polymerase sigma-B factor
VVSVDSPKRLRFSEPIGDRSVPAEALFARYRRDRDPATREALVDRFLPLAHHLARRYHGGADADDLQQIASLGLLKAIDRFDPERGSAFTSFAVPTILGELKRYFRDHGWAVRVPRNLQELKVRIDAITQTLTGELGRSPTPAELAERAHTTTEQILEALAVASAHYPDSLDQPLSDDGDDAIDFLAANEPGFEHVDDAAFVDGLLDTLSERERIILRLRFEEDLTQAEIGARLGISQMHVSRLIREAITTLRTAATRRRVGIASDG